MSITQEILQEMLESAVYQQLLKTDVENRIMGRYVKDEMQFKGAKDILDLFLNELKDKIHLILGYKIEEYCEFFGKRYKIDTSKTYTKIMTMFDQIGGYEVLNKQKKMLLYIPLTKLVEGVRKDAYDHYVMKRLREQYEKISEKRFDEHVTKKINSLNEIANPQLSILYSLAILTKLATIFQLDNAKKSGKRLITQKINLFVNNHLV